MNEHLDDHLAGGPMQSFKSMKKTNATMRALLTTGLIAATLNALPTPMCAQAAA